MVPPAKRKGSHDLRCFKLPVFVEQLIAARKYDSTKENEADTYVLFIFSTTIIQSITVKWKVTFKNRENFCLNSFFLLLLQLHTFPFLRISITEIVFLTSQKQKL